MCEELSSMLQPRNICLLSFFRQITLCFCFIILANDFLFVTFSLYLFPSFKQNRSVSNVVYETELTSYPIPPGYKLKLEWEWKAKSFSMKTNLQWKLYHFDDYHSVDAASTFVSRWDMYDPPPSIARLPSLITTHSRTHALLSILHITDACMQYNFEKPPFPFRNLCKFGFRFPSDHTDRRANVVLMNIVVGASVGVPCCSVHHKVICIHFGTWALHANQMLLVLEHFKISKNNINFITSRIVIFNLITVFRIFW